MFSNCVDMSAVREPTVESSVHDLFFHGMTQSFDWNGRRPKDKLLSQTYVVIIVNIFPLQVIIILAISGGAATSLLNIAYI